MAERKRRGDDAVDDRLEEALEDDTALDEDLADDELDVDLDEDFDDEDEADDEPVPAGSRGRSGRGTLTKTKTDSRSDARPGTRGRSTRPGERRPTRFKTSDRPNIFARFVNFVREVVAELRKVIWPTRKELLTYTAVVVVFVTLMLAFVGGLDWVFTKGVVWVFGTGETAAE